MEHGGILDKNTAKLLENSQTDLSNFNVAVGGQSSIPIGLDSDRSKNINIVTPSNPQNEKQLPNSFRRARYPEDEIRNLQPE